MIYNKLCETIQAYCGVYVQPEDIARYDFRVRLNPENLLIVQAFPEDVYKVFLPQMFAAPQSFMDFKNAIFPIIETYTDVDELDNRLLTIQQRIAQVITDRETLKGSNPFEGHAVAVQMSHGHYVYNEQIYTTIDSLKGKLRAEEATIADEATDDAFVGAMAAWLDMPKPSLTWDKRSPIQGYNPETGAFLRVHYDDNLACYVIISFENGNKEVRRDSCQKQKVLLEWLQDTKPSKDGDERKWLSLS